MNHARSTLRRALAALLLLLGAWLLTACEDNTDSPSPTPDAEAPDDLSPDLSPPDLAADTTDDAADAVEDAALDADVPEDANPPDQGREDSADDEDAAPTEDAADLPEEVTEDTQDLEIPEGFLRILSVEPAVGPLEGGTEVTITFEGSIASPRVQFAGVDSPRVEPGAGSTLRAVTPPGFPGPADVKLTGEGSQDTLRGGFRYVEALRLDAVEPNQGSAEGGDFVLLRGRAFTPDVAVSVGGRAAIQTTWIDAQTLEIIAPPGPPGLADVRVSNDDTADALAGAYTWLAPVRVHRLTPAAGPRAGGDVLIMDGEGLRADTRVHFGAIEARVTHVNDQRLEIIAPPGPRGPVDVAVTNSFGADGLPRGYTYLDDDGGALTLAAASPPNGPDTGGQEVILSGRGLNVEDLEISFGGQPARLIEITDAALRVRTPAHPPGVVDITLTHQGGVETLEDAYTYLPALRLEEVSPPRGPVEGGTAVVVRGAGFTAQTRFLFGPLEAQGVERLSDTEARMTTPPGSLGWSRVLAVDGPQRAPLAQGFLYEDARPRVLGLSPARGSIAGGTLLQLRGRGFWGAPTVSVGGAPCVEVEVLDQATLRCRTPPGREGSVPVVVDLQGQRLESPERFTYFHPGTRFGGAWGGDVEGAVNVSVFSIGGGPVAGAFVMLTVDGDTVYQGQTDAQGLITFSGEDVLGLQDVSATAAGHSSATVQAVNAENITILLFPTVPPSGGGGGGGLPLATITGQVSGFQKIAQPGPDERQIIIVETTRVAPGSTNPWPGPGNVVDPNGDRTYTLTSRVGDVAVIAWGGLINDRTGVFTPYALGIRRYLFVSQNETYNVNIDLTVDLIHPLRIKLNGAHTGESGPDIYRVTPWVDLGFEGAFGGYDVAEGLTDLLVANHQARLEGPLADATYTLEGGAWTGRGTTPYAVARREGVTDVDALIVMPTLPGTPAPFVPEAGGVAQDGVVAFEPLTIHRPDFWNIQIYQLPATLVWEVSLPGDVTWFQLPRFPDFTDLPAEERPTPYGYPGDLYMIVTGATVEGFDFDRHEYLNDLRGRDGWVAWTRNAWFIRLD